MQLDGTLSVDHEEASLLALFDGQVVDQPAVATCLALQFFCLVIGHIANLAGELVRRLEYQKVMVHHGFGDRRWFSGLFRQVTHLFGVACDLLFRLMHDAIGSHVNGAGVSDLRLLVHHDVVATQRQDRRTTNGLRFSRNINDGMRPIDRAQMCRYLQTLDQQSAGAVELNDNEVGFVLLRRVEFKVEIIL